MSNSVLQSAPAGGGDRDSSKHISSSGDMKNCDWTEVEMLSLSQVQRLANILHQFRKDGYLCDTVLVAEDGQLKAHAAVLAAASPVFKAALKSKDQPLQHILVMPGTQKFILEIAVQLAYTGIFVVPKKYLHSSLMPDILRTVRELGLQLPLSKRSFGENSSQGSLAVNNTIASWSVASSSDSARSKKVVTGNPTKQNHEKCNKRAILVRNADGSLEVCAGTSVLLPRSTSNNCAPHNADTNSQVSVLTSEPCQQVEDVSVNCVSLNCVGQDLVVMSNATDCTSTNMAAMLDTQHQEQPFQVCNTEVVVNSCEHDEPRTRRPQTQPVCQLKKKLSKPKPEHKYVIVSNELAAACNLRVDILTSDTKACNGNTVDNSSPSTEVCVVSEGTQPRSECKSSDKISDLSGGQQSLVTEAPDVVVEHCYSDHQNTTIPPKRTLDRLRQLRLTMPPVLCDVCGKSFVGLSKLKVHSRIHSAEQPYECQVCGRKFKLKFIYQRHLAIHTGERRFLCEFCGSSFRRSNHLVFHLMHLHPEAVDQNKMKAQRTVKQKYSLNRPATGAPKKRPFVCAVCNRTFLLNASLLVHMQVHEGGGEFRCFKCEHICARWIDLFHHMLKHTGERALRCETCGKSFSYNSLARHQLIHSDQRPYHCTKCPKTFRTSTHLQRHLVTHTLDKPYRCTLCSKAYRNRADLVLHGSRVHNVELRKSIRGRPKSAHGCDAEQDVEPN